MFVDFNSFWNSSRYFFSNVSLTASRYLVSSCSIVIQDLLINFVEVFY